MTIIACDIGGTNIKGSRFVDGVIVQTISKPNDQSNGKTSTMNVLEQVLDELWTNDVTKIGIVTAGAVDPKTGTIVGNTGTLQGWVGFSIIDELHERYQVPVFVENDANGAMVAEMIPYLEKGIQNAVMLTLGTGVGTGVYINGELYRGHSFQVEFGHMVLHPNGRTCTCGMQGCAEQYLSGTALTKAAQELIDRSITHGEDLFYYLDQGHPSATRIFDQYLHDLFLYLHNLRRTFDPEIFIIGGGVSNMRESFLTRVHDYQQNTSMKTKIVLAEHGNQAGMLGAYHIARNG